MKKVPMERYRWIKKLFKLFPIWLPEAIKAELSIEIVIETNKKRMKVFNLIAAATVLSLTAAVKLEFDWELGHDSSFEYSCPEGIGSLCES